jgi:U4/U6.U5 tri-snRNP-associated protein 1
MSDRSSFRDRDRDRDRRKRSRSNGRDSRDRRDRRYSRSRSPDKTRNYKSSRDNDVGYRGNSDRYENERNRDIEFINEEPIVKAIVSEDNGEISCSIDETNRIRALIGLKPLNDSSNKDKEALQNFRNKQESEKKDKEANEVRERIEKSRNNRLLNAKLEGKSLGEINNDDSALVSASDWVKRSRIKEISSKELLKKKALDISNKYDEEENENEEKYNSKQLKGMSLMHSIDDFDAGRDVVLTLADSNILDEDEDGHMLGLNDGPDVLENVNLAENDRRIDREKREKRNKQPLYKAYDDDEFIDGGSKKSLLSQYDAEKKEGPKTVLGDSGEVLDLSDKNKNNDDLETTGMTLGIKKIPQSLQMEDSKVANEYFTKQEYSKFDKPKVKKVRKIRKKVVEEDEKVNIEKLISVDSSEEINHGSRNKSNSSLTKIQIEEKNRKESYNVAKEKSSEKSNLMHQQNNSIPKYETKEIIIEIEDDAEISQSLARARKLALIQRQQQEEKLNNGDINNGDINISDKGAILIRNSINQNQIKTEDKMNTDTDVLDEEVDVDGRRADGSLVFTNTTEFSARLQARLTEQSRVRTENSLKQSSLLGSSSSLNDMDDGEAEIKVENIDDEDVDIDIYDNGDDEDDTGDNMGFAGLKQTKDPVNMGMSGALAMMRASGDLGKKEELTGRAKDGRAFDPSSNDHGIKLEYRDEFGRKQTQKESFRQLCYRFHGYGAGVNKRDKKINQMKDQAKSNSSKISNDSGTMKSLVKAQEATGQAHFTVQGGNNINAVSAGTMAAINKNVSNKAAALKAKVNSSIIKKS